MGEFSYEEPDYGPGNADYELDGKRARHDALLAAAYADGRRAGLMGLTPAGRPEDHAEAEQWLEGFRSGVAARMARAA